MGCTSSSIKTQKVDLIASLNVVPETEILRKDLGTDNYLAIVALLITIIGWFVTSRQIRRQFFLQKNDTDAKLHLPVLLELLENLSLLESGLTFRGLHWPSKGGHRVPFFSRDDVEGQVSYAKRGNDFLLLGQLIIKNCRTIIYLVPTGKMPKTLTICKSIKEFLNEKKEGQCSKVELMARQVMLCVANSTEGKNNSRQEAELDSVEKKISKFHKDLDLAIEEELPNLCNEKIWTKRSLTRIKYLIKPNLE